MILRIKELRKLLGISQRNLADALHVDQTSVSQWEREVAFPTVHRLPAMASVFNCTIDDLFYRNNNSG